MSSQALPPMKPTGFICMDGRLAQLSLGRLRPSKRFTSTHVLSVSALCGSTMQPNIFFQAPMGGGPQAHLFINSENNI